LPSLTAAFEAGADIVELDIHVSADGVAAMFHDARLECRTDGHGTPEEHTFESLRRLDVGYGYTADGGRSYPLRGSGIGLMPSLDEVLSTFAGRVLLLHMKSNREHDGEVVAARLERLPREERARIVVYGGARPTTRIAALLPDVRTFNVASVKSCLARYLALGWSGFMPAACRHTVLAAPIDRVGWLWGWPRRFQVRLHAVGSDMILLGRSGGPAGGVDDPSDRELVPDDFDGWVWTNRIETTPKSAR
jgi:glycerophosphoryl diester phosphodiesterase